MADSEPIVLFDLKNTLGKSWSMNVWKSRLLFAYKGIDYKTEWLQYHELRERIEPHHAPGEDGRYTAPTIVLPSGKYIMDSQAIAQELERQYPTPFLDVDSELATELRDYVSQMLYALIGVFIPETQRILEPVSAQFLEDKYVPVLGNFAELEKTKGGKVAYQAAKETFNRVEEKLRENGDGPFFAGEQVQYADFVWAGILIYIRTLGHWERFFKVVGGEDAHAKLLEGVKPWMVED